MMWYVQPSGASTPQITMAYQVQENHFIALHFRIILPSVINIETNKSHVIEVSTDAPITKSWTVQGDPIEHGFHPISYGKRYGNYTVCGDALTYIHDFWKVPSIELTDTQKPNMILVRPRDINQYSLGV